MKKSIIKWVKLLVITGIIITLINSSIIGCCKISKNEPIKADIDFKKVKIVFSELKRTLKRDDGKLWGYKLDGPLMEHQYLS